jgi:hypothetical protein
LRLPASSRCRHVSSVLDRLVEPNRASFRIPAHDRELPCPPFPMDYSWFVAGRFHDRGDALVTGE